jgi:hypothetical protein
LGTVRQDITPGWRLAYIGVEGGDVVLDGLNPWRSKWVRTDQGAITVAHPSYPSERHTMYVYELVVDDKRVRFAAGEFSNGVWGIYIPIS